MKKKLLLLPLLLCLVIYGSYAQCNERRTVPICDITTIDSDGDMTPDGNINLYDLTGTTNTDGTWSTTHPNAIILDTTTGNVSTWDIDESSRFEESYVFHLNSSTCGDTPRMIVHLVIGGYSGLAIPPDADGINFYICSTDNLDLSTVLVSNDTTPVAHHNGQWSFSPTSPSVAGTIAGGFFNADVPYQPGLPRVDQNIFDLIYTVGAAAPCTSVSQTRVRIAVVRQVDAGDAATIEICESDILAGLYDDPIDVTDDIYLTGEDIEGYWVGNPNPTINIRDEYLNITNNGANPRFGCHTFNFSYTVEKRSVVCEDDNSVVEFNIYESLREFRQKGPTVLFNEFCSSDVPRTIDLFDFIAFQDGFVYDHNAYTNWELMSGPSNLGLTSKSALRLDSCQRDPNDLYSSRGTISLLDAAPGEYRFVYTVCPEINGCPMTSCPQESAEIVIIIHPKAYAGEDTQDINLCDIDGSVDLFDILINNTVDAIDTSGIWSDTNTGATITNPFVFPTPIASQESFDFTYTLTTDRGCTDNAQLKFTIYKNPDAGESNTVELCSNDLSLVLFDQLGGSPDTTGSWAGPFGYASTDHLGTFIAGNPDLPVLNSGVYTYKVLANDGCSEESLATVTVNVVQPQQIGDDVNATFCKLDGRVNLFSLLDSDTARTGRFEDTDNTGALAPDGLLSFDSLSNDIYTFRYILTNSLPCDESSLDVNIQIIDLPIPQVTDQQFCILDAAKLDDIIVNVLNYNWYETLESETPIIDNPILLDNQTFYIAQFDANGCESERKAVQIDILNLGERAIDGTLCTLEFQDGISSNNDFINDTFDLEKEGLYNILEAFPDFELQIFNRYGTLVYEGNRNTQEFHGESNVSVRLGDDLPSGTYFYVFTPNFNNNLPIQGSFYLSR